MKDARIKMIKNPLTGEYEEKVFEEDFLSDKNELHINSQGYYHVYSISDMSIEKMKKILSGDMSTAERKYITEKYYKEIGQPKEEKPELHFARKTMSMDDLIEMLNMMEMFERYKDED